MADRKKKRAYLDDFEKDLNGNYQYRGAHYHYKGTKSRGRALAGLWVLCGGGAALVVAAGLVPGATAYAPFWLLLPYMAEVGLTGSIVWAMTRWQAREYPMRAYVYKATVKALPGRCMAEAVLAGAGAAAEVVYLLLSGAGGHGLMAALYLLLKAVSVAAALFARRLVLQSRWEPEEGNSEITTES